MYFQKHCLSIAITSWNHLLKVGGEMFLFGFLGIGLLLSVVAHLGLDRAGCLTGVGLPLGPPQDPPGGARRQLD